MSNESDLPDRVPASKRSRGGNGQYLNIENFHYSPSDLSELRRLAEVSPELASKVVDGQNQAIRLHEISERFGIGVAGVLAVTIVGGFVTFVVTLGWWQSIVFVLVLLGLSHVLRTILTGKWSETSWFGAFLKSHGAKSTPHSDGEE